MRLRRVLLSDICKVYSWVWCTERCAPNRASYLFVYMIVNYSPSSMCARETDDGETVFFRS